jgi:predicted transcriptional regulator
MTPKARKAAPPHDKLPRREREIMDAVFALDNKASAEDIRSRISDPPSYSAVRAMLARLEAKGYLRHTEDTARRYIYSATTPPATARKAALQQHLRVFFGGSIGQMMTALLNHESWTDAELDALQTEIDRVRKERKS